MTRIMTDREKAFLGFVFLLLVMMSSCSPQKRIARLCKNYPLVCTPRTVVDTVFQVRFAPRLDTLKVVEERVDTFEVISAGDTIKVVLRQDPIHHYDTVNIHHYPKPDTITTIEKDTTGVVVTPKRVWWEYLFTYFLGIATVIAIARWVNK